MTFNDLTSVRAQLKERFTLTHAHIGPAPIHKFGHFGMVVTDFAKTYEFYTSRFNLTSFLNTTPMVI
jgi:hypothetical protein